MLASRFSSAFKLKSLLKRSFSKLRTPYSESDYNFTHNLGFLENSEMIETFRVIDLEGNVLAPQYDDVEHDLLIKIYENMIKTEIVDDILLKSQRQGKISFYMTSFGETATIIGTAAALHSKDMIFSQYREVGAFIWRGFTIDEMIAQCAGNVNDPACGRQMPIHYSSSKLNIQCISSPLATQFPHASGAGFAFRVAGEDRISLSYMGEGATSEGDFHAALNFAATLRCQTMFACRNNKYAISTPSSEQFATDGIAARGLGYGIKTIRVDGNDAIAVVKATRFAREYMLKEKKPTLLEFMTYRIGDHSTSDFSTLYREGGEIDSWRQENDPIKRLSSYFLKKGEMPYTEQDIKDMRNEILEQTKKSLREQFAANKPKIEYLFKDVYDIETPNLSEQKMELFEVIEQYPELIDVSKYEA